MKTTIDFWSELDSKLKNDNWDVLDVDNFFDLEESKSYPLVLDASDADNSSVFNGLNVKYINIPLNNLASRLSELEKYKAKKIICICSGGPKSAVSAFILRMAGFDAGYFSGGLKELKWHLM